MSTYTYRYIEVKIECVDGVVWTKESLPEPTAGNEGQIFKISQYNRPEEIAPFYKVVERPGLTFDDTVYKWEPVSKVETKWVPLKWYSYLPKNKVLLNNDPYRKYVYSETKDGMFLEENLCWSNNGGSIRDDYISTSAWNNYGLSGRGLPKDVSEEVKKDITSDYAYDMTWVTLSEWEATFETAKERFRQKLTERFMNRSIDDINEKLDTILKTIKNPDYKPGKKKKKEEDDYYEDTIEYLFEEDIWELFNIQTEIDRVEFIVEEFDNNFSTLETRIIYYLA